MGIDVKPDARMTIAEALVPAPNDVCLSTDGQYVYAGCGYWMGGGRVGTIPIAAGQGSIPIASPELVQDGRRHRQ